MTRKKKKYQDPPQVWSPYATDLFKDEVAADQEVADEFFSDQEQLYADLRQVFGSDAGGRILYFLAYAGLYFDSANTGNAQTYANNGVQDFVRTFLENIAESDMDIYLELHRKHALILREKADQRFDEAP